eukprot:Skav201554  [mRNA]  locus=scaffold1616:298126:301252:+ [translate_table: standard]
MQVMQPLQPVPGASFATGRRFAQRKLQSSPKHVLKTLKEQEQATQAQLNQPGHATVVAGLCGLSLCYSRFLRPDKSAHVRPSLRRHATAVASVLDEEVEEDSVNVRRPSLRLDKDDAGNLQKLMITTPLFYANGSPHIGSIAELAGSNMVQQSEALTPLSQRMLWLGMGSCEKQKFTMKDYTGYYCVGCEAYLDDDEMDEGHVCKIHQKECVLRSEENYFFRLSKYWGAVRQHLEENPDFILPTSRRSQVLVWLEEDNKRDFSISRASTSWGIPVPGDDSQDGAKLI